MSSFALIQAMVIGVVVSLSAWRAFRKLLPKSSKRLLAAVSARLDRPGRAPAVRGLGRWVQPAEAKSGGCGTGDGCDSCSGCAPVPPAAAQQGEPIPLEFRSRP
jgi:hypothetical protein